MVFLYNIAFLLFALLYLPTFFLKKKSHDHLRERFGFLPKVKRSEGKILWLHTVSLGEALAALPLIQEIRKSFPNVQFAFSTTTKTGRTILEGIRKEDELLFYFPFDLSGVVHRVVRTVKPHLFVTMETEIWPNLILVLKKANIPIVLLNGRISKKSFRGYRWIRWALKGPLQRIDLFCMQHALDGDRIRALGADPTRIRILGNMKFDLVAVRGQETSSDGMRERLGLAKGEKLWVAGSTHPGEEKSLLQIYDGLSKDYPHLRLLIAPRHPERKREVVKLIQTFHREASLVSERNKQQGVPSSVLVLDTIGILRSIYAVADLVFIGGSLVPKGGQNPLEPALFAKPILFGPHMDNFQDIVHLFLKEGAVKQVQGEEELAHVTRTLLENERLGKSLGEKAKKVLEDHQGVVRRYLEVLREFLVK
ncbi:MAG: 3-deoxy-D-manno-octulosonic acid transferase [Candidatus Omnitrophica bacterium]|nr:3-deoxy-D-manno-octulosonic acid transferase [Candidatus Omnitrophota bacterium]